MERSPKLSEAVDFGINSTYLHAHMPKINSSSVNICESSRPRLARELNCYPRRSTRSCVVVFFCFVWVGPGGKVNNGMGIYQ